MYICYFDSLSFGDAFLVFLVVFLWAFASSSVARVWAVLAGGGALMTLSAWLIQQSMLS